MPVTVKKAGNMWRVVEAETKQVAKNDSGTPVDGGGHRTKREAVRQARAINAERQS